MYLKKYYLEFSVFICGAVVMVLELVGSRVLAPHVGTSIVVWTSLIGIILASLSIGYYLGGKRADKHTSCKEFAGIIFIAGLLIALTALIKSIILVSLTALFSDIRISASLATIILFAPASILLGMVSPYAAKLKMHDMEHAGTTVGTLYALSTIGSIVGTFIAGFYLIVYFGNTNLLYMLAIVLLITSVIVYRVGVPWKQLIMSLVILLCMSVVAYAQPFGRNLGFVDVDTQYQRAQIYTTKNPQNGRTVRILETDAFGAQSGQYLDSDELLFEYTKRYNLVSHFQPQLERTLMIGGGAYSYPKAFLRKFPYAHMDVVEIDPQLTALARTYFDLKENPRLHIFHEDGRVFLNRLDTKYDAVFIDAFHSLTPPFQLTTQEVVRKLYDHLTDNGVVLVNLISAIEGEGSAFLRAEYATYKSIFPQVEIFPVASPDEAETIHNIMLVASKSSAPIAWKSDDPEITSYLVTRWPREVKTDVPILTDEHAPVDQYLTQMYKQLR